MRRRGLPYLVVAIATAWVTRHFWWPGQHVVSFDTGTYAAPNWIVGKEAFLDGRLPLIDDRAFGGVPHLGNPQTGVLAPLRWLSYFFEPTRALNLLAAFHVLVFGAGATFLGRRLSFSRAAATVAGVVTVMCGATVTKSVQVEQIMAIAWLPWVLAFAWMVVAHPGRGRYVGMLSVAVTMTILSGHPQMTYEVAITTVVFVLALLWRNTRWRSALVAISAAVFASLLTCALSLAAAVAATRDSYFVDGRDIDSLMNGSLVLQARNVAQVFLGSITVDRSDVFAGTFESIAYLGVVAGVLAVLGLMIALRGSTTRRWSTPLVIVAALGLVWSLGPRTPVFRMAFALLPGFDQGRVSTRWLVVVSLIAALFVGAGVDAVRRGLSRRALGGLGLVVFGSIGLLSVLPFRTGDVPTRASWLVIGAIVMTILWVSLRVGALARRRVFTTLLALLVIEMVLLDRSSIVDDVRSPITVENMGSPTTEFLASADGYTIALTGDAGSATYLVPALRPNANALFDIASIDGYDGGVQVTTRWATSLERFTPTPAYDLPLRNSVAIPLVPSQLARLGVRWVLLDVTDDPSVLVPGWEGPVVSDRLFTVWENPAWVGPGWAFRAAATTDDAASDLRENFASWANTAIVDRGEAVFDCTGRCDPLPVDLLTIDPEHLKATVDFDQTTLVTAPRQALPGWHVTVDGRATDVVVVDGLFLGVRVEPGPHSIEWRYRPGWVTPAVIASVLGVLITLGLLWGRRPRWRRNTPGAPR